MESLALYLLVRRSSLMTQGYDSRSSQEGRGQPIGREGSAKQLLEVRAGGGGIV